MVKISKSTVIYSGMGIVIPVIEGVLNAGVVKLGHTFNLLAKTGLLRAGIFGAVQACAANLLWCKLLATFDGKQTATIVFGSLFGCHVLTGAALFAISLLAVKAGIIAAGVTVSTAVVLTLANFVLSIGGMFLTVITFEQLKKHKMIA